jgi:hypothetical protein
VTGPAQRRRDPQPLGRGWELPIVLVGGAAIAFVLAALVGLGLASVWWGGGWVWPRTTETITRVISGLLHGEPGRALPPDQLRRVAGPVPTYVCVALAELMLVAAAVLGGVGMARYHPRVNGMASRSEASRALGVRQLRDARSVIRPDRYGSRPAHRTRRSAAPGAAVNRAAPRC